MSNYQPWIDAAAKCHALSDYLLAAVDYYTRVEQAYDHACYFDQMIHARRLQQWVYIPVQLIHINTNRAAHRDLPKLMSETHLIVAHTCALVELEAGQAVNVAYHGDPHGLLTQRAVWMAEAHEAITSAIQMVRDNILATVYDPSKPQDEFSDRSPTETARKRVLVAGNVCFVRGQWMRTQAKSEEARAA